MTESNARITLKATLKYKVPDYTMTKFQWLRIYLHMNENLSKFKKKKKINSRYPSFSSSLTITSRCCYFIDFMDNVTPMTYSNT